MQNALTLSITINILFILLAGYAIHRKGGLVFLKKKLNLLRGSREQQDYDNYYKTKKSVFEIVPTRTNEILFLGDSITDYCEWQELFGMANIKNRGIDGDTINGVIDRLDEIVASSPKKIFLMIGINDLELKNSVKQILCNYDRLLSTIIQKLPDTKLFIQSVLPVDNIEKIQVVDILAINKGLQNLAEQNDLTYVNLFDLLKTEENKLNPAYHFDGLHLNGQGYLIWKTAILSYISG